MPAPSARSYTPTLRERVNAFLMGDRPSDFRRHTVEGIMGRSGVHPGIIDYTPLGIPLNAYEAGRYGAEGKPGQAALSGLAATPNALLAPVARAVTRSVAQAPIRAAVEAAPKPNAAFNPYAFPDTGSIEDIIGKRIDELGTPSKGTYSNNDMAQSEIWGKPGPRTYDDEVGYAYPGGPFMTRNETAKHIEDAHPTLKGQLYDPTFEDFNAGTLSHLQGGGGMDEELEHAGILKGSPQQNLVVARQTSDGKVIYGTRDGMHDDLRIRNPKPQEPAAPLTPPSEPAKIPAMAEPTPKPVSINPDMSRRGFLKGAGTAALAAPVAAIGLPHFLKAVETAAPAAAEEAAPTLMSIHESAIQAHMHARSVHAGIIEHLDNLSAAGHSVEHGELPDDFWLNQETAKNASMEANEATAGAKEHSLNSLGISPNGEMLGEGTPLYESTMNAEDMAHDAESSAHNAIPGDMEDYEHVQANHEDAYHSHGQAVTAHLAAIRHLNPQMTDEAWTAYLDKTLGGNMP